MNLTLCIASFGCAGEAEDTSGDPAANQPEKLGTINGIESTVYKYDKDLYRGGDIVTQEGMNELKRLGVKTVFSVTPTEEERAFAKASGITLVETPFTKTGVPAGTLPDYLKAMENAERPLYAHCHSGKNRGGTLLAAYRIHVQGWSFEAAKNEFVSLGGKDSEFPELMESIRTK